MKRSLHGFTLIELLVAISIIGLLIGLMLPALASVREHGKMTLELSASRQVGQAYIGYTLEHRGKLMPGFLSGDNVTATDGRGNTFGGPSAPIEDQQAAQRYPWRLVAYIDHSLVGSILVIEQAKLLASAPVDAGDLPAWRYQVSLYPSFGINEQYLGGDGEHHLQRLEHATNSSRMIVFASARQQKSDGMNHGFHQISAPHTLTGDWSAAEYDTTKHPDRWGHVHPRWSDTAVVAHLDGHSERLRLDEMRDMTRWSDQAAKLGDADWDPK